jgi:hypothetical protein
MNRTPKTTFVGALRTNAKKKAAATTPRIRIGKIGFVETCLDDRQTSLARRRIRQGRLRRDSASVSLEGVVFVAQNETYRAQPCTVGVISLAGGSRRTPSPTLLETIHAIQKRRNPVVGQSEFSADAFL